MHKYYLFKCFMLFVIILSIDCNVVSNAKMIFPVNFSILDREHKYDLNEFFDDCTTDVARLNKHKLRFRVFNQQEKNIFVKGEHFGLSDMKNVRGYFYIDSFSYDKVTYKLISYNKSGESDTLLFNLQLNSYNNRGDIIDALLVGSFFCYEDVARFSEFIINHDYTINIYKYVSYLYKVDESGLVRKVGNPEKKFYSKEKYKIQHGLFELMEAR